MLSNPSNSGFPEGHALESQPTGFAPKSEDQVIEEKLPEFMKIDATAHEKDKQEYKVAIRKRLYLKNLLVAFVAEFAGTFLFLFFSFGIATQASNAGDADVQQTNTDGSLNTNAPPNTPVLLYSSLGFGFSLAVNAWTFYRISGGLFNPAVTLALTLTGTLTWYKCIILTFSQIAGAIAAAAASTAILPGPVNARTTLSNGISIPQGLFLEFFLTAQLIFAIFMLAAEKHRGTFLAPVGIGLALFIGELLGTNYTGGSLNPARSLGPDVVLGKFDQYHWIYWVGPYAAAIFTAGFYQLLKYFQYETVNTGQDADETKQILRDPYGRIIGAIDLIDAIDFHYETPEETTGLINKDRSVSKDSSKGILPI
ncbi:aquaporin-like protein [Violaceomyces palustris]|uniref:Aquaporin-like protein n=1 Tax=Violaceomyces palustris TaxID=1673888 RepID=A0ACD0NXE9_9BASI|nr:aquaporin-like protein [Violaceomyces palustris]